MTRLAIALVALLTAQSALAYDFSNVRSGMLLGIYTTPAQGGMRVSGLIPGYSAVGRLYPGDVLLRVAVDENQVYRVRSLYEMENAKMMIGPNREAALEIWRPSQGLVYAWVEFTPIYGPAIAAPAFGAAPAPAQKSYAARFKMEHEKQGARAMFQRNRGQHSPGAHGQSAPNFPGAQLPKVNVPQLGQFDPSKLFNK